jgi:hypothetical protein
MTADDGLLSWSMLLRSMAASSTRTGWCNSMWPIHISVKILLLHAPIFPFIYISTPFMCLKKWSRPNGHKTFLPVLLDHPCIHSHRLLCYRIWRKQSLTVSGVYGVSGDDCREFYDVEHVQKQMLESWGMIGFFSNNVYWLSESILKNDLTENQNDFLDKATTLNINVRYPDYKDVFRRKATREFS